MSFLRSKRFFIISLIVILLLFLFFYILPISLPLIMALITALLLYPTVEFFQRKFKVSRHVAVISAFVLFIVLFGIIGYFLITKVVGEAIQIATHAPSYMNDVSNAWEEIENRLENISEDLPKDFVKEINQQVRDFLETARKSLTDYVNIENIKNIMTDIPNYLINLIVYFIALFLFMMELPAIKKKSYSYLSTKTSEKVQFMVSRLSYVVFGFLKAQFLVSVLIFMVSFIGLIFIVSPEVAIVMALVIWVIDFIPIIGSIVILLPWALFYFITGEIPIGTHLSILAILLVTIRRTIEPKVMGSQIGLSALPTLISMYLGLKIFGLLGFFIGPLLLIAFNSAREAGIIKFKIKL